MKNIDGYSAITQRIVSELQERDKKGRAKYGTTLDRTDLTRLEWLQHAKEESLDLACYLERMIVEESQPGENTHSLNTPAPPSNAKEIPYASLFLLNLKEFRHSADYKTFVSTFRTFFEGDWGTAKALANLLDNMEADRLMKTGDNPTPEFMLKMVGEVGKEVEAPHAIQRMFEACGVDVKFVRQQKVDMKEGE